MFRLNTLIFHFGKIFIFSAGNRTYRALPDSICRSTPAVLPRSFFPLTDR